MIKAITVAAVTVATLAAPAKCGAAGNHRGANPDNQRVCADIGAASQKGTLREVATQAQIKLDGAKPGVATEIRHAIDAYYTTDHHGTAQQLLQACADAGAPQ